jgi:hypothetical protein
MVYEGILSLKNVTMKYYPRPTSLLERIDEIKVHIQTCSDIRFNETKEKLSETDRDRILWQLLQAKELIDETIKFMDHPRMKPIVTRDIYYPVMEKRMLMVCDMCGDPDCTSDHK